MWPAFSWGGFGRNHFSVMQLPDKEVKCSPLDLVTCTSALALKNPRSFLCSNRLNRLETQEEAVIRRLASPGGSTLLDLWSDILGPECCLDSASTAGSDSSIWFTVHLPPSYRLLCIPNVFGFPSSLRSSASFSPSPSIPSSMPPVSSLLLFGMSRISIMWWLRTWLGVLSVKVQEF